MKNLLVLQGALTILASACLAQGAPPYHAEYYVTREIRAADGSAKREDLPRIGSPVRQRFSPPPLR